MSDILSSSIVSGVSLIVVALIARPIRKKVNAIDVAVNDQEKGMPTLVGRVVAQDALGQQVARDLAFFREWHETALRQIAESQGVDLAPAVIAELPLPVLFPEGATVTDV